MSEILFMIPVFKQMIWGGNKLGSKWGYEIQARTLESAGQ